MDQERKPLLGEIIRIFGSGRIDNSLVVTGGCKPVNTSETSAFKQAAYSAFPRESKYICRFRGTQAVVYITNGRSADVIAEIGFEDGACIPKLAGPDDEMAPFYSAIEDRVRLLQTTTAPSGVIRQMVAAACAAGAVSMKLGLFIPRGSDGVRADIDSAAKALGLYAIGLPVADEEDIRRAVIADLARTLAGQLYQLYQDILTQKATPGPKTAAAISRVLARAKDIGMVINFQLEALVKSLKDDMLQAGSILEDGEVSEADDA